MFDPRRCNGIPEARGRILLTVVLLWPEDASVNGFQGDRGGMHASVSPAQERVKGNQSIAQLFSIPSEVVQFQGSVGMLSHAAAP
jgi:hypothetical protein